MTIGGVTVSSTHIRKLLEEGDVETARAFLGHPHVLTQTVGHGRQLGRTIGIPTANLVAPPHVLLPRRGVYAAKITLPDGRAFGGVTNVGVRPTVNNGQDVTVAGQMTFTCAGDAPTGDITVKIIRLEATEA